MFDYLIHSLYTVINTRGCHSLKLLLNIPNTPSTPILQSLGQNVEMIINLDSWLVGLLTDRQTDRQTDKETYSELMLSVALLLLT